MLCAVCHRPELLLLDEPAGGLDPVTRREFLETSIQLLNREGSSILFSSHQMSDVERLGGRVVLLDEGKVRLDRELDALREAHCVVMVPGSALSNPTLLAELPGCLRTRVMRDTVHAVFEGTPAQVQELIAATWEFATRTSRVSVLKICSLKWWAANGWRPPRDSVARVRTSAGDASTVDTARFLRSRADRVADIRGIVHDGGGGHGNADGDAAHAIAL